MGNLLKDKDLSDDRLFSLCLNNKEFSRMLLEIILGVDIEELEIVQTQKAIRNLAEGCKGVCLDAYIKADGKIYNVEMQCERRVWGNSGDSIVKRARFYQSMIDTSNLQAGSKFNYNDLKDTIIIFIADYDVFGRGLYSYRFREKLIGEDSFELSSGTEKIFLNTKGTVRIDESDDLIKLLEYISDSRESVAEGSMRVMELSNYFIRLKGDENMNDNYLRLEYENQDGQYKEQVKQVRRQYDFGNSVKDIMKILGYDEDFVRRCIYEYQKEKEKA